MNDQLCLFSASATHCQASESATTTQTSTANNTAMTQNENKLPPAIEPVFTVGGPYPSTSQDFSDLPELERFSPKLNEGTYQELRPMKKPGVRRFSRLQTGILENEFNRRSYLDIIECQEVCAATGLSKKQVRRWFYNRRTKEKKFWKEYYNAQSLSSAIATLQSLIMSQTSATPIQAEVNLKQEFGDGLQVVTSPDQSWTLTASSTEEDCTDEYTISNLENVSSIGSVMLSITPDIPSVISDPENVTTLIKNNVTLSGGGVTFCHCDQWAPEKEDRGAKVLNAAPAQNYGNLSDFPNTTFSNEISSGYYNQTAPSTSSAAMITSNSTYDGGRSSSVYDYSTTGYLQYPSHYYSSVSALQNYYRQ